MRKSSIGRSLCNLAAVLAKAAYDCGDSVVTPSELEISEWIFLIRPTKQGSDLKRVIG
jgi:hypothetical protein